MHILATGMPVRSAVLSDKQPIRFAHNKIRFTPRGGFDKRNGGTDIGHKAGLCWTVVIGVSGDIGHASTDKIAQLPQLGVGEGVVSKPRTTKSSASSVSVRSALTKFTFERRGAYYEHACLWLLILNMHRRRLTGGKDLLPRELATRAGRFFQHIARHP